MIILVQPMYSKQEINSDSNYVIYTALIRAMRQVRPEWHWVVIFPDAQSGFKYDDDGFFRLPNVTRVPQRISTRKKASAIAYDADWYDALMRQFGFDLVWTHLPELAGHLRFAGQGSFEPIGRPIVVAAHDYVIHDSLPYPFEPMLNIALAQVSGAIATDWNVFNSAHCQQMWVETAAKWCRADVITDVLHRSSRIACGVLETDLAPVAHDHTEPIIIYNHRLQSYKNYRDTFAVLAELHAEGIPFRVRYTNSTRENLTDIAHYPFVEVKLCATRAEYLRAIADGDLNVSNSQHETFCISAVESMAFGQPLVAPRAVTFPEITGEVATGYPYLFASRDEQKAHLRRLLTDADERQRWGATLSTFVRTTFTQDVLAQQYAGLFDRLYQARAAGTPDDVRAVAARVLKQYSGADARAMYNAFQAIRVGDRQPFSSQSLPLPKLNRLVRELGGRVVIERGVQRMYA